MGCALLLRPSDVSQIQSDTYCPTFSLSWNDFYFCFYLLAGCPGAALHKPGKAQKCTPLHPKAGAGSRLPTPGTAAEGGHCGPPVSKAAVAASMPICRGQPTAAGRHPSQACCQSRVASTSDCRACRSCFELLVEQSHVVLVSCHANAICAM